MRLKEYLNNKPIFYKKIDYERMPKAFQSVKDKIIIPDIVHVVGTNGKGSTGRFLTQLLSQKGKKVGHYTSPHIFSFNERFYLNNKIVNDDELEEAHQYLQSILGTEFKESLSYFEYATFLAAILFRNCDYVVFEAGMGAEFDATNYFNKTLTLFTPISLDHLGILGNNIEEISHTKLISMNKNAILNDVMNVISVKIAKEIAIKNGCNLKFAHDFLDDDLKTDINNYIKKHKLPNFQISNLALACAGAKFLKENFDLKKMDKLDIQGRMERISKNIIIDVGHNEDAAKQVVKEFENKKITLIYNAFLDKDVKAIFDILKPIIKNVEIFRYESDDRELATQKIKTVLSDMNISFSDFEKIKDDENYFVFGSFVLVENFLKYYMESNRI